MNPLRNSYFKGHFLFLSRISRFKTILAENLLGEDPPPPPSHLQYQNYHVIRVFCVERLAIVQKTISYRQLTCMVGRFKPYFCRMERTTKTLFFSVLFSFFSFSFFVSFFFCFACQKIFGKLDPPPPLTKIPRSAPDSFAE